MRFLRIAGVLAVLCAAVPAMAAAQAQPNERTFTFAGGGSRIGVGIRDLRDSDLAAAKLTRPEGVFIESVEAGTPAERAGLKSGDIVIEYDGERVRGARHFTRLVQETPVGRTVAVVVNRSGARQTVSVMPEEGRLGSLDLGDLRGRIERGMEDFPFGIGQMRIADRRLGLTLVPLSNQLAAYFGVKNGVLVSEVVADSPAAQASIKAGDVITMVDGRTVESPGDVTARLRNVGSGATLDVTVTRDKREVKLQVRLTNAGRRPVRGAVGI